ncbi:MAG: FAD-dependent oxidoreductase [Victivallaceae bacterium]|nr:FAD-dependent oxidoreductase [Victivallaceae bacterium]
METMSLEYSLYPKKYDVVVIGGGTAGAMAAMAAGREGASVLLVEREYALGGTSTLAQTTPRMTNHMTQDVMNSSLSGELQTLLVGKNFGFNKTWFNPQLLKCALEEMCEKYGVDLLYGADFLTVVAKNGTLTHAVFQTVAGAIAVAGKSFIDATGNAAVAVAAGCPVEQGDGQGRNQPMTLRFALSHVDIEAARDFMIRSGIWNANEKSYLEMASLWCYNRHPLTDLFRKAVEDGVLTPRDGNYFQSFAVPCYGSGVMYFNCPEAGHIRNALDPAAVTEMVVYSRKAALRLLNFMRKYVPGFENCELHSFAEMPGVRESRRIVGEYYLTEPDYDKRSKFPDGIAQTAYPIDIHDDSLQTLHLMGPGEFFEVPFRSMIPKNVNNLLAAGRCVSASFRVQGALRIQLVCMAMGEAAGIAAGLDPHTAVCDGAAIRRKMMEYGGTFA